MPAPNKKIEAKQTKVNCLDLPVAASAVLNFIKALYNLCLFLFPLRFFDLSRILSFGVIMLSTSSVTLSGVKSKNKTKAVIIKIDAKIE